MKKYLLLLLSMVVSVAYAQKNMTAVFDFTKPDKLNPPVVTEDYHGGLVTVFDKVFKSGNVTLTSSRDGSNGSTFIGTREISEDTYSYYLTAHHANFTLAAPSGSVLTSIVFSGYMNMTPTSGALKGNASGEQVWTPADGTKLSEATFLHLVNQLPEILTITVNYQAPLETMSASASIIDKDSKSHTYSSDSVPSFHRLNLDFGSTLDDTYSSTGDIVMIQTDKDNVNVPVTVGISGNRATITANTDITTEGDYRITIPEGAFVSSNGYYQNGNLSYAIKVRKTRTTFDTLTVDPVNHGSFDKLVFPVKLTFPYAEDNYVSMVNETTELPLNRQKEGEDEVKTIGYVKAAKGTEGVVTLNPVGEFTEFSVLGVYTIVIPEAFVHNQLGDYNPKIALTYTVTTPPDPLQGKKNEVAALKEKATALADSIGVVGCPKVDDATNPLSTVKDMDIPTTEEELDAAIASLNAAIDAFYKATDVTLPTAATKEDDGWYYIVGRFAGGKELYMQFVNDGAKITLTTNKNTAAAFQVVAVDETAKTVVFKSKDGKFLHIPHIQANYDVDGMTLTDGKDGEPEDFNKLKLEKFLIAGKENQMGGLFTIFGNMGTKSGVAGKDAYTLYQYDTMNPLTDPDFTDQGPTYFDENKTNAFALVSTIEPQSEINALTPEVDKETINLKKAGDEMTVTIMANGALKSVKIADGTKPYFKYNDINLDYAKVTFSGEILSETDVVGRFNVNTSGLAAGLYTLVMPEGTFAFETAEEGKTVKQIELLHDFSVETGTTPAPNVPKAEINSSTNILTIKNVTAATLSGDTTPYFSQNGSKVSYDQSIAILTPNADGTFSVNTTMLTTAGTYLLVMPAGTFNLQLANGTTQKSAEMEVVVTVGSSTGGGGGGETGGTHEFSTNYVYYSYPQIYGDSPIQDIDLNSLTVFIYKGVNHNDMVLNPAAGKKVDDMSTSYVKLGNYWNAEIYRGGHFEKDSEFEASNPGTIAYKVVWDPVIKAGDYDRAFSAGVRIEEGAFGDENYAAWLNDHSAVTESQCRVNARNVIFFSVNNIAAGITELSASDTAGKVVYDLQGRRVTDTSKKGVYIVNGKKVVIK